MDRVPVEPKLIKWARERDNKSLSDLTHNASFKKLPEWESGTVKPTFRQLKQFADAVQIPFGYLFLSQIPQESSPIPDFRTVGGKELTQMSSNLLQTIYTCQARQNWYHDFMIDADEDPSKLVGVASLSDPPALAAKRIQELIGFDLRARNSYRTWKDSYRQLIKLIEDCGVLVMVSGVVKNNPHRTLDPEEFRGFALSDSHAPLIFVNGKDSKSAQLFTLAHELAHICIGSSAVSNLEVNLPKADRTEEVWCNKVAAEFLVPGELLRQKIQKGEFSQDCLQQLTRNFKVSNLVILRRLYDEGVLDRVNFQTHWNNEQKRLASISQNRRGGGNFSKTTLVRVSNRFARTLIQDTLNGHTKFTEAYRMLGIKSKSFNSLAQELGLKT